MSTTHTLSKVPAVTLGFWLIKILATTLGEVGGDAVTLSMGLGYLVGTALFAGVFVIAVSAQIRSRDFQPWLYWFAIVASTTVGTTLADYVDRSLGIGYSGGTALGDWAADTQGLGYGGGIALFGGLLALVAALYLTTRTSRTALFWTAFILTRPLGAVVGDFLDKPLDHGGLALSRYAGTAVLLVAIVACIALLPQRAARRAH
ncbi:hypothetical protein ACIPR8_18100 [Stenotrophomonas sp. LARHCG68]